MEHMIRKGQMEGPRSFSAASRANMQQHIDNLYRCVSYCANEAECRRTLIVEFFGERFDRKACHATCDNCMSSQDVETKEVTSLALDVIDLVRSLDGQQNFTLIQLASVLHGDQNAMVRKTRAEELDGYGKGRDYSKAEIDRVLQQMVIRQYLKEEQQESASGYWVDYVQVGPQANLLLHSGERLEIAYRTKKKASKKRKSSKAAVQQVDALDDVVEISDDEEEVALVPSNNASARRKRSRDNTSVNVQQGWRIKKGPAADLRDRLEQWRNAYCLENNWQYWNLLPDDQISSIAALVPRTVAELRRIEGFGEYL